MRKVLLLLTILCDLSMFGQVKYEAIPTDNKSKQRDLSFLVTFDKHGVNADFAGGDGISTTMPNTNLGLRGVIGFDGKCAYRAEPGENLKYNVHRNADPHKGTLILWTAGLDYSPGREKNEDGKSRGNIALVHLVFTNDQRNIEYQVYEYAQNIYFDWRSSEGPQGWGSVGRAAVPRTGIKKGEWHQLAFTWNDERIVAYLNGKKITESVLPQKVKLTADIKAVNNEKSFIGIKSPFYEDKHTSAVGVDDVAIYSRPLTALEIKNQYVRLLKDRGPEVVNAYSIVLNGVNIGRNDKIDRLEAEFDFASLTPADSAKLKAGKMVMDYVLTGPDGKKQTGKWTFSKQNECRVLNGVDKPGKYTLETRTGKEKVIAEIVRPDFSWIGNGYGDEDEVPAIWRKDFGIKDRVITAWNREYRFEAGPLPTTVKAYGKSILAKPPRLLINGKEPVWKAGPTKIEKRWITLSGTGMFDDAVIDYTTRVEFDGFIKFDWTIKGKPEIFSMKLEWQMAPGNHQFLMTPYVNEEIASKVSFPYPQTSNNSKMLWFVAENKGGFAYTMINDSNWVYDAEKPVFFADKSTGSCRVEMISKKVRLPEETPYCALFIATPTRPLPELNRLIQYGDSRGGHKAMINGGGNGGMNSVFTHEPHPTDFEYRARNRSINSTSVYGGAEILTTKDDVAVYLRKYLEMPGAYSYNMPYHRPIGPGKYKLEHYFSLSVCSSGVIADYNLMGQHKLYNHKYGNTVWQVYYDICGDSLCGNRLHGCCFKDKFGREVKSFTIISKRDLIRRTVSYAHRYGKTVMLHAQRDFIPMLQGLADYWFPGEQYGTLIQRNPYGYTDEIPDVIYRSEFNRNVIGVGIIFLPQLALANRKNFGPEGFKYTEAMLCMLQSHDIETSQEWAAGVPIQRLWDCLSKYGVQDPATVCHRYYEQKEIFAGNPDLRITWYHCPGERYVLFLANKGIRPISTTVDLNRIKNGSFPVHEEYRDKPIAVKDGKFEIRVPARSFRIAAFPPRGFYPLADSMEKFWSSWKLPKCDTEFGPGNTGCAKSPCSEMRLKTTGGGCFLRSYPIKPGKTYRLKIMAKHSVPGSKLSMNIQGRENGKIVAPPVSKDITADGKWQSIELEYTIPTAGVWGKCDTILVTLAGSGTNAVILFDDFQMEECN